MEDRFEYKVIHYKNGINDEKSIEDFNLLGGQRWKLVTSVGLFFYFIRKKL